MAICKLRIDDLDDTEVAYWCNIRTEGSLLTRQSEKLEESTRAEGTTGKFQQKCLGNDFDLAALGHKGPSKMEQKSTQAGLQSNNLEAIDIGIVYSFSIFHITTDFDIYLSSFLSFYIFLSCCFYRLDHSSFQAYPPATLPGSQYTLGSFTFWTCWCGSSHLPGS